MLALLLVLVGLLELMAAGSRLLIGGLKGELEAWVLSTSLLSLLALCSFVLARGVWTMRSWVPLCAVLLTLLLLGFAMLRFSRDASLDLALALVFLLAIVTNLGLLGWAHLPDTRTRLRNDDGTEPRTGDQGA